MCACGREKRERETERGRQDEASLVKIRKKTKNPINKNFYV